MKKFYFVFLITLLMFICGCSNNTPSINKTVKEPEKKVQIVDVNSKTRPYAVMINNINIARQVQSGLSQAYIVYELIVEGGVTRYLALFKDVDVKQIGSVRSARHYYLDYVLENDAIFVHWGYSPQAQEDIKDLKINNVNGLVDANFYRSNPFKIPTEHTGFITSEGIQKVVEKRKYRTTTENGLLIPYSIDSIDLTDKDATDAKKIKIQYSNSTTNYYDYDEENKVYKRSINSKEQKDYNTDQVLTVKNIIAYYIRNYSIKNDSKGRQFLDNIGSGEGYYYTEGKAVKIKWSKDSRSSKTKYTYLDGTPLVLNDGNTFIQIVPKDGKIEVIESSEE